MRRARMRVDEHLVKRALLRPPVRVVLVVAHDVVDRRDAGLLHRIDDGRHGVGRIERIVIAVLDVERAVREIAEVEVPLDARVAIGEHQRLAVDGHARGPRVRLTQREKVGAGSAVRNSGDISLRFVDVIPSLHLVEQAEDAVNLALVPPRVVIRCLRLDINLRLASDALRLGLPAGLRRTGAAASVAGPPCRSRS